MNKFQAMAKIMALLNEDQLLKPGSQVYKMVRQMVSGKIDRLGPEGAMADILDNRTELRGQIKILCMWHRSTHRRPPDWW
jgi:hypothetical protein